MLEKTVAQRVNTLTPIYALEISLRPHRRP